MEALDQSDELVSQKDALQIYLSSLLNCSETPVDIESEEVDTPVSLSEALYNNVFEEINNSDDHVKKPRWATEHLSCLPITISEMTLLIPLRQVRTVMSFTQEVDSLDEMPDWVLGEISHSEKHVKVVDMQKIIKQKNDLLEEEKSSDEIDSTLKLVMINGGDWGLTCDAVGNVLQLNRDEILWRAKKTDRRWIAGVSTKHQLAIVDIRRIEFAMSFESRLV